MSSRGVKSPDKGRAQEGNDVNSPAEDVKRDPAQPTFKDALLRAASTKLPTPKKPAPKKPKP